MVERLCGVRNGKGKDSRSGMSYASLKSQRAAPNSGKQYNEHRTWRSEKVLSGKAGALNPPKQYPKPQALSLLSP